MKHPDQDIDTNGIAGQTAGRRPTLTLDVALYEGYLEDSALSDDDRRATLEALWAVIVGFVDLGFAVEPNAALREQTGGGDEEFASLGNALLDSSANSTSDQFAKAATHIAPLGY